MWEPLEGAEMKVSLKHQERMFGIAHRIKFWSDCPQGRQHACVLAVEGKYIISTGYNGAPSGCQCLHSISCATYTRANMRRVCKATHAEANAVNNLYKCTPYTPKNVIAFITKKPCKICLCELRLAQVSAVYWQEWHKGYIVDKGYETL